MMDLLVLRILPFAALGAFLAVAYLSALGLNVRLYLDHTPGWVPALFHLTRLLTVAATLALCARAGAFALLSSVIGFQLTRTVGINQRSQALEKDA